MKPIVLVLIAIVVVIAAVAIIKYKSPRTSEAHAEPRKGQAPPNVINELRDKLFTMPPTELGLSPSIKLPNVWGVVMEIGFPDSTATLFSLAEGTTSLYFSSGGGIIGGGEHDAVRKAASEFLTAGEASRSLAKSAPEHPLPKSGMVKFYILTYTGVVTVEAEEANISKQGHPLYNLFLAGNNVMTELRLIEQRK